jgi:hypothetical protein
MPGKTARVRECALVAQDIDEHAIPALFMKTVNRSVENLAIIHGHILPVRLGATYSGDWKFSSANYSQ